MRVINLYDQRELIERKTRIKANRWFTFQFLLSAISMVVLYVLLAAAF